MPPLDPARCSLLRDDALVERYNAVQAVLDEAVRELPNFGARAAVGEARAELARLAETMTKERFAIGFIGPSQAGKSTTVNNLLAIVNDEDAPSPRGTGAPTTSVPTRLVPKPPARDSANAIRLHYFSKDEFRARLRDICDLLGLGYNDNVQQLRDAARRQHAEQPHFKAADHEVLIKLLDAAIAFPEVLTDAGREEPGDFAQRRIYSTHQDLPTKYTLLREVQIDFVTDAISPEVEMIDLPGLGVDKESDDRLTLSLVHRLDGAFMFQESTQLAAAEVAKLAERMRMQYTRTLGERIWMVVTRSDVIDEMGLTGPTDEPNPRSAFCHIADVMRRQGVKDANVLFVGNHYYKSRVSEGLGDTDPPSATLVARYPAWLKFGADGSPVVPEKCAAHSGQVGPWQEFVRNGGIPGLRETMQTKVADSVREQTRRDVAVRLAHVIERLVAALEAAEQQSGMPVEEMLRAGRWSGELGRLAEEVGRDAAYSQAAVTAIEEKLGGAIVAWGPPDRARLAENHEQLAGLLALTGLDEAATQTAAVVARVTSRLETRSQEQPPPDAAGLPKPMEHWTTAVTTFLDLGRTFEGRDFRGPIFRGFREDPSPLAGNGQNMGAADYPIVMRAKAARVARVYGSRLVQEIQSHLLRLQGRYRCVGTDIEHIDRGRRELYAKYRADLERLRT